MRKRDDDKLAQSVAEVDGHATAKDAIAALGEVDADRTVELHFDCDGDCGDTCGVQRFKVSEIMPKVQA
jgi:uncharacterized protein YqkB